MSINPKDFSRSETDSRELKKQPEMTVGELLSAISENEYPDYIFEAVEKVRKWMINAIEKNESEESDLKSESDIFSEIFDECFDDEEVSGVDELLKQLGTDTIEKFADVIPSTKKPDGKPDILIVSLSPSDYENGIRTAIDYAAVFNRPTCRRVWIISDNFVLDEIFRFVPHVDALAEQGITLRFILVTPWGWVELPLSGSTVSKHQFLWQTCSEKEKETEKHKRRRKK